MSNKSSQLDYIPTSLVKSCADTFSIIISHLANLSFTQATFPSKFKLALISPLLKKPGLPKSELSNFRPISNLNTIGKMLERLALARLFPHTSISPSFCPLQSAYRKFHSTETALLKLTNDIMETIDSGKITILTALDMSAAFDTLDHATLLHRLQHTFGLSGYVISWVRSYLTNRTSFVKIDSSSSPNTTICTGVPQGSVLGPLLFVLFISPVASVINPDLSNASNIVSFHQYADDTQLYIGTNLSMLADQVASIESCTQRVHNWLLNNGLHLNPSKSEAIAFFNPRSKPLESLAESIASISVAGSPIKLQSSIKNLGVYLDSRMSFDRQVSETCKASYFHIRALRHIRPSLTTEACKTIAAAIVGSRLDYCNSLLAGTKYTCRYWKISFSPHHTRSLWVALASCSPQNKFQDCYYNFQGSPVPAAILSIIYLSIYLSSYLSIIAISPPLFHGMYQHDHCDLLLHCHYVFLLEKPKWPSPNHFHLLPRVFGISSQVIFHPFPLFLLSGRNSSTIFFEVPFPVIPHHPLPSRFVMSAHPQMRLRSDTPHRLANTFQLSAYD